MKTNPDIKLAATRGVTHQQPSRAAESSVKLRVIKSPPKAGSFSRAAVKKAVSGAILERKK